MLINSAKKLSVLATAVTIAITASSVFAQAPEPVLTSKTGTVKINGTVTSETCVSKLDSQFDQIVEIGAVQHSTILLNSNNVLKTVQFKMLDANSPCRNIKVHFTNVNREGIITHVDTLYDTSEAKNINMKVQISGHPKWLNINDEHPFNTNEDANQSFSLEFILQKKPGTGLSTTGHIKRNLNVTYQYA